MKRRLVICLLVAAGALLSWSLATTLGSQLFDDVKSREEIDMMSVILNATLDRSLRGPTQSDDGSEEWGLVGFGNSSQINGYYLYGQGALFTITLNVPSFPKAPFAYADAAAFASPPSPPSPPAPASGVITEKDTAAMVQEAQKAMDTARAQLKLHEKDIAKQLEKVQEQTRHWREQMEGNRAKMSERLAAAKGLLMDALAKHGDSLTVVKPQEYITMIISGDSDKWFVHGMQRERTPQQILSVQKSVISDYKAGKFSLEEFKKKVLSYTN